MLAFHTDHTNTQQSSPASAPSANYLASH